MDNKESEYVSKVYSIKAGTTISNYIIELQNLDSELPEGVKITDIDNNFKHEFSQNDKFKILIPIKNLTKETVFNILVKTKINNKPVLYGKAGNQSYQDYALTAATYEDAIGNTQDKYYKNETKVKIVKQDQDTKERLENVEFNILDYNKKILYSNLKTNSNGEVEITNFLPGKYYLQEVNTKDGYILSEELIGFDVLFNQELTLTVNNLFERIPNKEVVEKIENKWLEPSVKKLPVTGM